MERVVNGVRYNLRRESFERFDYEAIEHHLEEMAAQGWFLEKIDFFWEYRQGTPSRKKYSVTYIEDYSNILITEEQQELDEFCSKAGWIKVAMWDEMQIYCSDEENPVPVETDEWSRLTVIKRAMKKRFAPNLFSIAIWICIFYIRLSSVVKYPELSGPDYENWLYFGFLAVLIIHMGFQGIYYIWWGRKSEKSLKAGGACEDIELLYKTNCLAKGIVFIAIATFIYIFWSEDTMSMIIMVMLGVGLVIMDWPTIRSMISGKWSKNSPSRRIIMILYFAGIICMAVSILAVLIGKIIF